LIAEDGAPSLVRIGAICHAGISRRCHDYTRRAAALAHSASGAIHNHFNCSRASLAALRWPKLGAAV
jgi:hypothetical protein